MAIDEKTCLDLRQWFEANMGERLAHAVMEAMPPIDHSQLATRADVELVGRELRAEVAGLRGELRAEMAELRAKMAELRGDARSDLAGAVRLLVTMQVMSFGATIAAVVGLAAFLAP